MTTSITAQDSTQETFLYAPWHLGELRIDLITVKHYDRLPDGTELITISGKRVAKNDQLSKIDRFGFLPYGFPSIVSEPKAYEGPYRER